MPQTHCTEHTHYYSTCDCKIKKLVGTAYGLLAALNKDEILRDDLIWKYIIQLESELQNFWKRR